MNTPGRWLLKIVLLLNIDKRLPSVQNDSLVMNTPGSLNSPVVNTLGSLSSPEVNTLRNLKFLMMNTPVSRLLGVLWTSTITGLQKNFLVTNSSGVRTPQCIHHKGVLPTWCILPRNNFRFLKYSWYGWHWNFVLKKFCGIGSEWFLLFRGIKCSFRVILSISEESIP
jgi:hypothetical protein